MRDEGIRWNAVVQMMIIQWVGMIMMVVIPN